MNVHQFCISVSLGRRFFHACVLSLSLLFEEHIHGIYDSILNLGEMNLWKSVKGKVHMTARQCSTLIGVYINAYMLHYYLCADNIMFEKLNFT